MNIVKYEKDCEKIKAYWDEKREWKKDPLGYFLIRLSKRNKNIEVGFCGKKDVISIKITGKSPQEIYYTILRKKLVSNMHHSAYLGKELHKAYIALKFGLEYTQDEELEKKII